MSNTPKESSWPFWHHIPDGLGSEDQCSKCLEDCREENLEAVLGVDGKMYYACPDCAEELRRDFEP
jgi:hypothetical protein